MSTAVPFTTTSTGANGDGPTISLADFDGCTIKAIKVMTYVTAQSLAASTAGGKTIIRLDRAGVGPLGFDLVNLARTTMAPLSGTRMGTTGCTSSGLVFAEGNPPFSSAAAPYNGIFAPYGDDSAGDQTFNAYKGKAVNGDFNMYVINISAPITFECFAMELEVQ